MKEGLIERIRELGYWRVNFRPISLPKILLTLGQSRDAVQRSAVSLRGWDFPHISHRSDDEGGYENFGEYVENWTEWYGFKEFWRMYKSSQFLSFIALREDTMLEEHGNPTVPILNSIGTLYSITEYFEFASRLSQHSLYEMGVIVELRLVNTKNRRLVAGQNRMPFFDSMMTQANEIRLERRIDPEGLVSGYREIAVSAALELFDHFGWNPAESQIAAEQDKFLRRDFGY